MRGYRALAGHGIEGVPAYEPSHQFSLPLRTPVSGTSGGSDWPGDSVDTLRDFDSISASLAPHCETLGCPKKPGPI